jgi:exoribonuclease-2
MAVVNLQTREARKLQTSSTRYWALEYLRRQPRGTCYHALILRFLKEREPLVLVIELGIQANAVIMTRAELGSEITVMVDSVQPRKDVVIMREVLPAYALSAL